MFKDKKRKKAYKAPVNIHGRCFVCVWISREYVKFLSHIVFESYCLNISAFWHARCGAGGWENSLSLHHRKGHIKAVSTASPFLSRTGDTSVVKRCRLRWHTHTHRLTFVCFLFQNMNLLIFQIVEETLALKKIAWDYF